MQDSYRGDHDREVRHLEAQGVEDPVAIVGLDVEPGVWQAQAGGPVAEFQGVPRELAADDLDAVRRFAGAQVLATCHVRLEDDVGQLGVFVHELPECRTRHPLDHSAAGHPRRVERRLPGQHVQLADERAGFEADHDLLWKAEACHSNNLEIASLDEHEVVVGVPGVIEELAWADDRLRRSVPDAVQLGPRGDPDTRQGCPASPSP